MLRRLRDSDGIVHLELPGDLKLPDDEYVVIDTKRAHYKIDKHCMRDFSLLDAVFTEENVTCIACLTR